MSVNLFVEWGGALCGLLGAALLASHGRFAKFGWPAFLSANFFFITWAVRIDALGLLVQQLGFMLTSLYGLYKSGIALHSPMKKTLNQGQILVERESLELTKAQMAEVLGLDGEHKEQMVTDFESGFRPPRGAVLRVYESLNRNRWAAKTLLQVDPWSVSTDGCIIHHNAWPRFVGRAFKEELLPNQWQFKKADMPVFLLDPRTGYRQLVIAWTDHVPAGFDPEDILAEGVRQIEKVLREQHGN